MTKINRHRIRQEDLVASMQPSKKQTAVHSTRLIGDVDRDVEVFTIRGKEDFLETSTFPEVEGIEFPMLDDVEFSNGNIQPAEDRNNALAKIVNRADWERERYYIKCGPDAKFMNPVGLDENMYGKRNAGEAVNKFYAVNRRAFILYIQFLKTKNKAYLHEAEREMA